MVSLCTVLLNFRVRHARTVGIQVAARPHCGGGRMRRLAAPNVEKPLVDVPLRHGEPCVMDVLIHVGPAAIFRLLLLRVIGGKWVIATDHQVSAVIDQLVNMPHVWVQTRIPCESAMWQPMLLQESPSHTSQLHEGDRGPATQALVSCLPECIHCYSRCILHLLCVNQFSQVFSQKSLKLRNLFRAQDSTDDCHAMLIEDLA
mmetsp:Transcript_90111/g.263470  ORF Transcript_90111/g.263470 Transcript_90111/m.263470 type:complete len:202 (+) Transcript_90111:165-770(+)